MIKTSKLVDSINLKNKNEKYELAEVLIDSDNSDVLDCLNRNQELLPGQLLEVSIIAL